MADFSSVDTLAASLADAAKVRADLRKLYNMMKYMQSTFNKYKNNTDANFVSAVNYLYTTEQKQSLGQIFTHIDNWVTEFDTNHPDVTNLR